MLKLLDQKNLIVENSSFLKCCRVTNFVTALHVCSNDFAIDFYWSKVILEINLPSDTGLTLAMIISYLKVCEAMLYYIVEKVFNCSKEKLDDKG